MKYIFTFLMSLFVTSISFSQTNVFPSDGNVGIGTLTPNYKLQINGSVGNFGELRQVGNIIGGNDQSEWTLSGVANGGAIKIRANSVAGGYEDRYLRLGSIDNNGIFSSVVSIFGDGLVGIGTTTPISLLDVRGRLTVPEISFALNGTDDSDPYRLRKVQSSSNVNWLELQLNDDYNESFRIYGNSCEGFNCLEYSGNLYHSFDASGNVYHKGNVGIGTVTPDEKLTVKGKIHAEEVRVDLNVPGPDYVFEQDYQLKSLPEIQAFIKENKHLPEIPSAKEMEKNGVNLSEMNMLLLKKVEELTLHLIKQDEHLKASQQQQANILKQLAILMQRNEDLEKQIQNP
jgi:hypothetical protein